MNGWVSEMPGQSDLLTAVATIIGSVGAAVAVGRNERRLSAENEKLKDSLLRWKILTVLCAIVGGVGWLV